MPTSASGSMAAARIGAQILTEPPRAHTTWRSCGSSTGRRRALAGRSASRSRPPRSQWSPCRCRAPAPPARCGRRTSAPERKIHARRDGQLKRPLGPRERRPAVAGCGRQGALLILELLGVHHAIQELLGSAPTANVVRVCMLTSGDIVPGTTHFVRLDGGHRVDKLRSLSGRSRPESADLASGPRTQCVP